MSGDFISIAAAGGGFRAYLAVPEAGSGPGLVLFHDISDEDQDLRDLGDLYAAEGYVVLCPEAPAVAKGVEDVVATVEALRACNECTGRVGALGFGLGGKLAGLAAAEAGVDCAISYYGFEVDLALDLAPRVRCPLIIHFAEKDPQVPPPAVARVKQAFAGPVPRPRSTSIPASLPGSTARAGRITTEHQPVSRIRARSLCCAR